MMTLCSNENETHQNCRLLNSFRCSQWFSEHLRTFSVMFAVMFSEVLVMTRQKSHVFD